MQLGPAEVLVVLVIALLIFGPNKLPEVGRQVGRAFREVKRFQHSMTSDIGDMFSDDLSSGAAPAPTMPPKPVEAPPSESDVIDPPVEHRPEETSASTADGSGSQELAGDEKAES